MLGRLARWLRILGYDTWYFRQIPDRDLAAAHQQSGRILLTRDTGLLRTHDLGPHLGIQHDHWRSQLRQVLDTYALAVSPERVFTRCVHCNQILRDVPLTEVHGRIPDFVASTQKEFQNCTSCGRVFWPGSHRQRVLEILEGFAPRNRKQKDT